MQPHAFAGKVRTAIEEKALRPDAIAEALRHAGGERRKSERAAMMEQNEGVEFPSSERPDKPSHAEKAVMAAGPSLRPALDEEHVLDGAVGFENLVGGGAETGDQRHRPAEMTGQHANMRQMPDHVADARQGLGDRDPPR